MNWTDEFERASAGLAWTIIVLVGGTIVIFLSPFLLLGWVVAKIFKIPPGPSMGAGGWC